MTKSIVSFSRALGDETRWRIIWLAMDEAMCVCELADILGMPQSSVSSHVQIIRKAGLFESERCGKWTYFRIDRRARKLIEQLVKFQNVEPDALLSADAKRAAIRLQQREESCCTGPNLLAKKKPKTSSTP